MVTYWLSRGRVDWVLIGKKTFPDRTKSLRDHFPINVTSTWSIPDHFSSASYLMSTHLFLTVRNYHVGSPVDADHLDHLSDWFPIAWLGLINFIRSAVGTWL